jgi:hypothetical protein
MNTYVSLMQMEPWIAAFVIPVRLLLGLFLAVVIYRNGARREALEFRIPAIVWSFLVLVDPVFGLIAYWLINRDAPYREIVVDEP